MLASSIDRRRVQPSDRISIDPLLDDQALAIETRMGLIVILGCSHSGLINTLEHVKKMSGIDEIFGVIGGTHLISSSKHSLHDTIKAIKYLDIKLLSPCHCTGSSGIGALFCEFGDHLVFNGSGTCIEI